MTPELDLETTRACLDVVFQRGALSITPSFSHT
jgi:hypothetical protein